MLQYKSVNIRSHTHTHVFGGISLAFGHCKMAKGFRPEAAAAFWYGTIELLCVKSDMKHRVKRQTPW